MTICSDDDWKRVNKKTGKPENVGMIKATEAAFAIGAKLAVPDFSVFSEYRRDTDTDFNDLNRLNREHENRLDGLWAVFGDVKGARAPGSGEYKERRPKSWTTLWTTLRSWSTPHTF